MIINFTYGFTIDGFIYGWSEKQLFRLPSRSGNRYYPMKKLNKIPVGNKPGYRLKKKRYTIEQLKDMTVFINQKISNINHEDLPF